MSANADKTPVTQLVTAFLEETTSAFEPWVQSGQGDWSTTLSHSTDGRLEPTTADAISGIFFVTGELRTASIVAEITFGDRELLIEAAASPRRRPLRHSLWEWADAVGNSALVPRDTGFVIQLDRLRSIVGDMASALRTLEPIIAAPPNDVLDRLAAARAAFRLAQEAERREREHRQAVTNADEAFRRQEWEKVVALLTPVEDRLSPAETAKLHYARRGRTARDC